MYEADTELLPTELEPGAARLIYSYRLHAFFVVAAIAFFPLLVSWMLYTTHFDPGAFGGIAAICLLYAIMNSIMAFVVWGLRGSEDVIKELTVLESIAGDLTRRSDAFLQKLDSLDYLLSEVHVSNAPLSDEEIDSLRRRTDILKAEANEYLFLANALEARAAQLHLLRRNHWQRLNDLDRRSQALRNTMATMNCFWSAFDARRHDGPDPLSVNR